MALNKIMFNNGTLFKYSAMILQSKMDNASKGLASPNDSGINILDLCLFVPAVVNCAFACELFMKSMLCNTSTEHNLARLFGILNQDIQDKVRQTSIAKMQEVIPAYNDIQFQADLNSHGKVFVDWRYFHEGNADTANLQFLFSFMDSLSITARQENI
ncbi:hypothetical protein AALA22_07080 [Anaerovoracaceae bacterium 41-7]|uniref:hypothetical protein n=1 Tax=Emergencia sp. JLR.KK010 TaxID=3114296 RepID=UPI0030D306BA